MKYRAIALGTSVLALGLLGGFALKESLFRRGVYVERYLDGRVIPPGGLLVNPNGLKDLAYDAESDFKALYTGIVRYANEKGEFPDDPRLLIGPTAHLPEDQRVTPTTFFTTDYRKADRFRTADETFCYEWTYRTPRADGTKKQPFPPRGERDVWLATDIYIRDGKTVFRDGSFTVEPVGYYLTMWSDGKIERTPLRDHLLASLGDGGQTYFFRGESGSISKMVSAGEGRTTRGDWWPAPAGIEIPAALVPQKG